MVTLFWFRRDLRLEDNKGLLQALKSSHAVLPIFIFDSNILSELKKNDPRVQFIHDRLRAMNDELNQIDSGILIRMGDPVEVISEILREFQVVSVYTNRDYEPYARKRDEQVNEILKSKGIAFNLVKDQVIFEESQIVKSDGEPYTIYTPYKNKWLEKFNRADCQIEIMDRNNFNKGSFDFPKLESIGFAPSAIRVKDFDLSVAEKYAELRDYPALDATSNLSVHLRFGTVGIRTIINSLKGEHQTFLSELIWREFFMQILYHYPKVVHQNFKSKYDGIKWRNDESDFKKWCAGKTGYPLVDAGMRELNSTGFMHNRVRMVVASFLCKHLLIDWRWGEAYFAENLLDFELSSNNGNWQWAAGTGCDSAPYFRIFNPSEQLKKFDSKAEYVKKWVPEYRTSDYIHPIVEHSMARNRALSEYKKGIEAKEF